MRQRESLEFSQKGSNNIQKQLSISNYNCSIPRNLVSFNCGSTIKAEHSYNESLPHIQNVTSKLLVLKPLHKNDASTSVSNVRLQKVSRESRNSV